MNQRTRFTRREFLHHSALAAGATVLGSVALAQPEARRVSPNEKLNLAVIGAGGRGATNAAEVSSENIAALCAIGQSALRPMSSRTTNARVFGFNHPRHRSAVFA
jgi:hypothetical protein